MLLDTLEGKPRLFPAGILGHCALPGMLESQPIPAASIQTSPPPILDPKRTRKPAEIEWFYPFKKLACIKTPGWTSPGSTGGIPLFGVPGSCIPTSLPVHVQPVRIPPATPAPLQGSAQKYQSGSDTDSTAGFCLLINQLFQKIPF